MTPTRCTLVGDALHGYAMAERPDGKWVGYDEYLAARAKAIEECAKYLENIGFAAYPDRADAAAWKRAAHSLRALQKQTTDIGEKS